MTRSRLTLLAALCASAGCDESALQVRPAPEKATTASATASASAAPPAMDDDGQPKRPAVVLGPSASAAPPATDDDGQPKRPAVVLGPSASASREEREREVLALLAGEKPAIDFPTEATDPGKPFSVGLRNSLGHSRPFTVKVGNVAGTGLPVEVVTRIGRQNLPRMRNCYLDGLQVNPTLQGRVTARFSIQPSGDIGPVTDGGSDIPDARVVACVLKVFQSLSFPAPETKPATFTFPVIFSVPE